MKVSLTASIILAASLAAMSGKSFAMGQRAHVYETANEAGIWDHGDEFFLRLDLAELADLKDQKFLWAGFHFEKGGFVGEVVADQFGVNERSFPARAKLLSSTASGRYFLIEILNEKKEVIKEIFVKGPASVLPER